MSTGTSTCLPLSLTWEIADFPIANLSLREHQQRVLDGSGVTAHPLAWINRDDLTDFLASGQSTMVEPGGTALAWKDAAPDAGSTFAAAQ